MNKKKPLVRTVTSCYNESMNMMLWYLTDHDIPERYDKLIVKACIEGDESNYAWQEYPVKRAEAGDTE